MVVVGAEPLLEVGLDSAGQAQLFLYGLPGSSHRVETNPTLQEDPSALSLWRPVWDVTLSSSSLKQSIPLLRTNQSQFYRARRMP